MLRLPTLPLLVALIFPLACPADEDKHAALEDDGTRTDADAAQAAPEHAEPDAPSPASTPSITHHQVELASGRKLDYTAEASTLTLKKEDGTPHASIFSISYTASPREGQPPRPVLFCFNGGPGSSSVWLHLGGIGPRVVRIPDDGLSAPPPPAAVENNPHTILAVADLVFVDPVSTGFSRPEKPDDRKDFHGLEQDISSLSEFIRLWITTRGRWDSPKFLLGESYGALRVAGLAQQLQSRHGMPLNGVVLLSGVLDFETLLTHQGNDLPYVTFLPALAATAHYHQRLPDDLQALPLPELEAEALDFASSDYLRALTLGNAAPPRLRREVASQLARFTGLPPETIHEHRLLITPSVFRKALLKDQGLALGRFDARVTGPDQNPAQPHPSSDPSYSVVFGTFATAMNAHLRHDLKVEDPRPYEILTSKVHPWDYSGFNNRYVKVNDRLADALLENSHLRVLVQCAHFDLATPPQAMLHSINQMDLPAQARRRISVAYYEGGHMFYTNPSALEKLRKDLGRFLRP